MVQNMVKYATYMLKSSVLFEKLSALMMVVWPAKIDLTNWGRVTHICVNKLTIIDSDNGLPPGRHQAIIWTNDDSWSISS